MNLFDFDNLLKEKHDSYRLFTQLKSHFFKEELLQSFQSHSHLSEEYLDDYYSLFLTGLVDPNELDFQPDMIFYYSKTDEPKRERYISDGIFQTDGFEQEATFNFVERKKSEFRKIREFCNELKNEKVQTKQKSKKVEKSTVIKGLELKGFENQKVQTLLKNIYFKLFNSGNIECDESTFLNCFSNQALNGYPCVIVKKNQLDFARILLELHRELGFYNYYSKRIFDNQLFVNEQSEVFGAFRKIMGNSKRTNTHPESVVIEISNLIKQYKTQLL